MYLVKGMSQKREMIKYFCRVALTIILVILLYATFAMSVEASGNQGYLDEVNSSVIRGWAQNPYNTNASIETDIYIRNYIDNSIVKGIPVLANQYRADVGSHGFTYYIDWNEYVPMTYKIEGYAIYGSNPILNSCPKYFTVRPSEGAVDAVDGEGIRGWSWKPDAPNKVIQTHIYIRKMDGTQVYGIPLSANQYRGDLANLGYGNGYHGFSISIPWSSLPEEKLMVTVYAVDGSGSNSVIYNNFFENRKKINMIGMTDDMGRDFSVWINSFVMQYCNNIGCSATVKYNGANNYRVMELIKDSSYCVISTHGNVNLIQCNYNGDFSYLTSSMLETKSADYFDSTRCVLIDACLTANGGANNPNNLVNTLHRKGVWSVVGFQEETTFYYNKETNVVSSDDGNKLWSTIFTKSLSEGNNINTAIIHAENAVLNKNGTLGGLDSVYVAGDRLQIVKH